MGAGVTIADIDDGVNDVPEFQGRISPLSRNFTVTPPSPDVSVNGTQADYDHGSLVGGVLVANAGNGVGAAGVAPSAQLMNLKCSDGSSIPGSCI